MSYKFLYFSVFRQITCFYNLNCIGLIQKWLATGMQEAPQQLAAMDETLILQGGQVFFQRS